MYLKKMLNLRHTLAFRLTLWYAAIFAVSSFGAFLAFYLLAASVIHGRTDQDILSEIPEYSSLLALKGFETLKTALDLESESEGMDKIFFRIVNENGEELFSSNMSSWGDLGIGRTALQRLRNGADHVFETVTIPEHRYKVRILYGIISPGKILQIGMSLGDDQRILEVFREVFGGTMAVLIILGAIVGWFMARRALVGVEELTRTATDISKGAFEQRVSAKDRGDEINRLATAFNVMLDRINELVAGIREMTENMAHDLRSPITRIRGMAEMTLITSKSMDEYKAMATDTIEECNRLLEMVNTMLDISEAEAGAIKLTMEKTDMAGIVQDACELFQPAAAEKGLTLTSGISDTDNLFVYGDIQRLQRMVANLLDNALKYTPSGGTVTVSVTSNEGQVVISVSDTGIGISKVDLPHIFTRFYRCDQSRSQAGIGLGLSLARAITTAHGGNIAAISNPGKGTKFIVTLPQSSPSE
ncbi:MAG: HAMP domain-containing histidine kinase [Desulfobacterales bacterium]|nr:HAMP domain-containing histidine kinase [Desulfobacterales bacterium]